MAVGEKADIKESGRSLYRILKPFGRFSYLIPAASTFLAPYAQPVQTDLNYLLSNRDAIVRAAQIGAPIGLSALEIACGKNSTTSPTSPDPGNGGGGGGGGSGGGSGSQQGLEFSRPIVELDSGIPINSGEIVIPKGAMVVPPQGGPLQPQDAVLPIRNGLYSVEKSQGLVADQYSGIIVRNTDKGYERSFKGTVSVDGITTSLMDGRMESPLNLINRSLDQNIYAQLFLETGRGGIIRPVKLLPFEIIDNAAFTFENGRWVRREGYTMRPNTLRDLLDALKNDIPIWTDGWYPREAAGMSSYMLRLLTKPTLRVDTPSYVKLSSNGDAIDGPDKVGGVLGATVVDRVLIYLDLGLDPSDGISLARNIRGDIVQGAAMGYRPDRDIPRISSTTDVREAEGYRPNPPGSIRVGMDPKTGIPDAWVAAYAKAWRNRPPGSTLSGSIDKSP